MPLKLYKRTGQKHWYMRGTVAGVSVHKSTGLSNKAQAENIRIRTENQINERASLGKKATATFAEAALNYIESGGETRFLPPILHHFGEKTRLNDVDNDAVNRAARALYPNAAPATVNRQLIGPISAIMTLAAEDGLCDLRRFRRRKVTTKKLRWLSPVEVDALLEECAPHLHPIISFMIGTGARTKEALTLQRESLYVASGECWLEPSKNGSSRMLQIPPRSMADMQTAGIPDGGAVFRNDRGLPYSVRANTGGNLKKGFNRAKERVNERARDHGQSGNEHLEGIHLGADVTPHTMRHTWATWYYAQTRDFGALLDLGGWADAATANIYRKAAPADLGGDLLNAGWDFRRGDRVDNQQPAFLRKIQ